MNCFFINGFGIFKIKWPVLPLPIKKEERKYICVDCGKDVDKLQKKRNRCGECLNIFIKTEQLKHRLKQFNLTIEEYNIMFVAQKNRCAICKDPETTIINGKLISLCVDHNHETGITRQLLCRRCNTTLGFMGEDIKIMRAMLKYIKKWG